MNFFLTSFLIEEIIRFIEIIIKIPKIKKTILILGNIIFISTASPKTNIYKPKTCFFDKFIFYLVSYSTGILHQGQVKV